MRALEQLHGLRVVADPEALDGARWAGVHVERAAADAVRPPQRPDVVVLRTARDEAFAVGATAVEIDDPHAIVEPEAGFAGRWLTEAELRTLVIPHLEWPLPSERPALAQGSVGGVPARIWLGAPEPHDGVSALLVTAAAYAHELETRLR